MKKQVKKNLIAALSLAFVASLGVAGLAKTDVYATGDVEEVAVAGNFQMDDGAAIRIKSNSPSGIRWSVTVSESYYNYVTSLGDVQWGMVVDNKAITEKGGATQVDIPLKNQTLPEFNANDGVEETWTYYASITYDELAGEDADTLTKVYETVLYARAYNVVNDVTTLAVDADTGRSIKNVAMNCLIQESTEAGNDDVTTDNKSTFVEYAGGEYAVTATKEFNNESAYATYAKTGVVTAEVTDGTYAAYFGAKYLGDVTAADGKVTVNPTGLAASQLKLGELSNINLVSGSNVTQVPFIAATHNLKTIDEFITYTKNAPNGDSTWYAVLLNDIDFNDKTESVGERSEASAADTGKFFGTFNGLGHTVSNWQVGGRGGVFGPFSGTLKNVAFIDIVNTRGAENNAYGLLFGYTYGGLIEDVYVKGSFKNERAACGVNSRGNQSTWTNCVFDVTFVDGTATHYVLPDQVTSKMTNVYAIGNATQISANDTTVPYATAADFAATGKTLANASENDYWTCDDYNVYFGNSLVAQNKTTNETVYLDEDTTISLSELTGGDVEKVLLNGNQIPVSGDDLTCVVADYTVGELNTISVYGNGKIVEQPFVVCTYVINTYKEFDDVIQDTINAVDHDSTGWYIVLGNDIDANDGTKTNELYIQNNSSRKFEGTFNGLGHTVSNLKVVGQGGIFGQITGATIENVAFVNLTKGNDWYILSNYCHNTNYIRNVYISGTTTTGEAIITRGNGSLHLNNVIANITNAGTKTNVTFWEEGSNTYIDTATNYAIGDFTSAQFGGGTTGATLCKDVATFLGSYLTTITAENGWNMDVWSIKDGALYFGNTKVQ